MYGVATHLWTRAGEESARVAAATLALQLFRMLVRMGCCGRVYGVLFALGVPLRAVYANALNSAATFHAVWRFASAKALRQPLKWLKTEHAYPARAILLAHKRKLGEILVAAGYLTPSALESALATLEPGTRLGQHLIDAVQITVETLYEALSMQQGLPVAQVDPELVPEGVAHALPEKVAREWGVLPFRVADGSLYLASSEIPTLATSRALRPFTSLELRFHLVTPAVFDSLANALL